MIIEMIAGDVGERPRRNAQTVEAELIKPVGGRLDREMRNAVRGQSVERAMQGDGIRRGQRAVGFAARRYNSDRADAGGAKAQRGPNLTGESGDRSFSARSGDGGDDARLAGKNFGGHQRGRAPAIAN